MANHTQTLILKTFENMLERMPMEKITVTALIKECNIGRNTFYYHYEDIYALLNDAIMNFFGPYGKALEDENWREPLKALLYACRDNKKKFYHIYNSLSRGHLEQLVFNRTDSSISTYIQKLAGTKNADPERIEVITNIVEYSVYGYIIHFFWNDMKDDIEESIDKLGVVFDEILDKLLR